MALVLGIATILWTGEMLASLKWGFLDRYCAGMPDGRVGIDLFGAPRGYDNLRHGNSAFLTELSRFGTMPHPF